MGFHERLRAFGVALRPWLKRLGFGRRVFIDCGSNTGAVLGERMRRGLETEFYAFEPQPELATSEQEVRRQNPGVALQFFPQAVWIEDGMADFFLATQWGPNHRGGSTLLHGHVKNAAAVDYAVPVRVKCIDFSRWIRDTFRPVDQLVVKMDIEGAEYAVLEKMIHDGSISYVSELIVEFHWQMNDAISQARQESLVQALKDRLVLTEWH